MGSEKAEMGQGEHRPGECHMDSKQKVRAAMGEISDSEGQEGVESKEGRSWVRPHSEHRALVPSLPAVWAHYFLCSHLQVFQEASRSLFFLPPHLSHSHLQILSTSGQSSLLASSSGWKRHSPLAQNSQTNGGGCVQNPYSLKKNNQQGRRK